MTRHVSTHRDFQWWDVQISWEIYHERNPVCVAHHSLFSTLCARYWLAVSPPTI